MVTQSGRSKGVGDSSPSSVSSCSLPISSLRLGEDQAAPEHFLPNEGETAGKFVGRFGQPTVQRARSEPAAALDFFRMQCEWPFGPAAIHPDELLADLRTGGA